MTSNEILALVLSFISMTLAITCILNIATAKVVNAKLKSYHDELEILKKEQLEKLEQTELNIDFFNKIEVTENSEEIERIKSELIVLRDDILNILDEINEIELQIKSKLKKC